jgi:hypothetical protein
VVRLPYEELVDDPQGTVRRLVGELGLDPAALADAWTAPDVVDLPVNHSMAGNRTRHGRGPTPIVADARWRDDLHPAWRVVIEILSAPIRRRLRRPRPVGAPVTTPTI